MCRKYAVPKEEVELQGDGQEERDASDTRAGLHVEEDSSVNGHMDNSRRRRPISVIGGVDLFASPDEKENAHLPAVSLPLFISALKPLIANQSRDKHSFKENIGMLTITKLSHVALFQGGSAEPSYKVKTV